MCYKSPGQDYFWWVPIFFPTLFSLWKRRKEGETSPHLCLWILSIESQFTAHHTSSGPFGLHRRWSNRHVRSELKWMRQYRSRDSQVLSSWPGVHGPRPTGKRFPEFICTLLPQQIILLFPHSWFSLSLWLMIDWEHVFYCCSFIQRKCSGWKRSCLIAHSQATETVQNMTHRKYMNAHRGFARHKIPYNLTKAVLIIEPKQYVIIWGWNRYLRIKNVLIW